MFGTKYSKTNQLQKFHQVPNKCIEYKIFELKYGNTKLLNIWKFEIVRLLLVAFA